MKNSSLFSNLLPVILGWLLLFSNVVFADVCDLPGGSGIGGTGIIQHGSGIGGTGLPVQFNTSGIGGTGSPQINNGNGSGIGGTGMPLSDNHGIGGTGDALPKTGEISGTITGFGSICVNGIEIHYAASTPMKSDGQLADASSLAIGQFVTASISGVGNEVQAKEIHIIHAARGPVSTINIRAGEIYVLGQKVILPGNIDNTAALPKVGDYVAVSGLNRPDGSIIANRIDVIPSRPEVSVLGPVSAISHNSVQVHGIKVTGTVPANIKVGQPILVSGKLKGNHIVADQIQPAAQLHPPAEVGGMVSFETIASGKLNKPEMHMSGRTVVIPEAIRQEMENVAADQKVILTGRLDDMDRVQVEHVHIDEMIPRDGIIHDYEHTSSRGGKEEYQSEHEDQQEHERGSHENGNLESRDQGRPDIEQQHERRSMPERDFVPEQHEQSMPEHDFIPEHQEVSKPEYEQPEIPEFDHHDFEAPEIPEIDIPETHEFETPDIPEFEKPEYEYEDRD